jgi:hypothetical protein
MGPGALGPGLPVDGQRRHSRFETGQVANMTSEVRG